LGTSIEWQIDKGDGVRGDGRENKKKTNMKMAGRCKEMV